MRQPIELRQGAGVRLVNFPRVMTMYRVTSGLLAAWDRGTAPFGDGWDRHTALLRARIAPRYARPNTIDRMRPSRAGAGSAAYSSNWLGVLLSRGPRCVTMR